MPDIDRLLVLKRLALEGQLRDLTAETLQTQSDLMGKNAAEITTIWGEYRAMHLTPAHDSRLFAMHCPLQPHINFLSVRGGFLNNLMKCIQ